MLVIQDYQKGKALFLKGFQNFGMWSFDKNVEEMMLRVKVFTFGDLDSLSVWFSLMGEKEGDLGRRGPSRSDWREEVGCEVEWLFGRVGKCCCFFAFFFREETCFP